MPVTFLPLLLHQEIANRQCIHLGAQQATDRFIWVADDGFVFVEAGVEDHRDAGFLFEGVDQRPVARVDMLLNRLQAPDAVNMGDRGVN